MKEQYLSPKFISQTLKKIDKYRQNTKFNLQHSALLVVDMQKYFSSSSSDAYIPGTQIIIPKIKEPSISRTLLKAS